MEIINTYKKVIDILAQEDLDYKSIVIKLAKRYPETFVELVDPHKSYADEVCDMIANRKLYESVKLIRAKEGLGLYDAKQIMDNLVMRMYVLNKLSWTPGPERLKVKKLEGLNRDIYNKLIG
jgi:ribosomal protein L7/L12